MAFSQSQKKISVSTAAANADLDATGYGALTYVEVKGIGSVGETGNNTNILSYDTLANDVVSKAKGMTNAGDPPLECARIAEDPGQILMRTYGLITNHNNYAFKVELQDGSIQYLRGLVTGPTRPGGRNEDFELEVFTVAVQQTEVMVAPPT